MRRRWSDAVLWVVWATAACGGNAAPEATVTPVVEVTTARRPSVPASPPSARMPEAELRSLVCRQRSGCNVVSVRPAGAADLRVALVQLPPESQAGELAEDAAAGAISAEASTDVFEARFGGCVPFEYWLVSGAEPPRLLLEICNDGHGAAGIGEDRVTIPGDGTVIYEVNGGSAWRWDQRITASLAPFRLLTEASSGMWTLGDNEDAGVWDWQRFSGTQRWSAPRCDPSTGEPTSEIAEHAFVLIPSVPVDEAFAAGGWRTTALGACGAHLGDSPGAAVGAVVMGDVLYVEVKDDRTTSKDVLEVWFAERAPGYMDHCLGPPVAAGGLSISLSNKKARTIGRNPAAKGPRLLEASTAADGRTIRMAVQVPSADGGLTVAFRDSDNDRTVSKVVATSELDPADTASLGRLKPIAATLATCSQAGGKLEPVLSAPPVDRPLIPF